MARKINQETSEVLKGTDAGLLSFLKVLIKRNVKDFSPLMDSNLAFYKENTPIET